MLQVVVEDLAESVILRCVGNLNLGYETALLCAALRHSDRSLVLDLSQVDSIDRAGMGALISLQAAGIYLQLRNPSPSLFAEFSRTGLDALFEIQPYVAGPARDTVTLDTLQERRASRPAEVVELADTPS